MKTHDARKLPSIAQEDLRIKAVRSDKKANRSGKALWGFAEVGQHLVFTLLPRRFSRTQSEKAGPGPLTPRQQVALIIRLLRDRCPEQLKLPFYLWTGEAVADVIEKKI